jgi:hypothetical protein
MHPKDRGMVKAKHVSALVVTWLAAFAAAYAGTPRLQSYQAKNHINEEATV